MLAALIITARESLEASLIVGILLAYVRRTDNRALAGRIWLGAGTAALASLLLAVVIVIVMGDLTGDAKEAVEGVVMLLAIGVLVYVLAWMRHQGHYMSRSMHSQLTAAAVTGSLGGVAALSFLAVIREGLETALYLAAMATRGAAVEIWAGAGMGFVLAMAVGVTIYRGSHVLNLRTFFRLTTVLLVIFGAGLVAHATLIFQGIGVLPGTITIWDSSVIVSDSSTLGGILRSLVGYAAEPSLLQAIFATTFVAVLVAILTDFGERERMVLSGEPFRPIGKNYKNRLYALLRWPSALFVASLMGVYVATGHRSETLASLPWPLVFFGLIAAATAGYLALAQVVALAARISFRQAVSTFGYIFLPLGFSTAILTFGADSFEFFGVGQPTASLLLAVGFVWSAVIAVSIVRNACQGRARQLAAAAPVAAALLAVLFLWLSWYASGTVVDLT